MALTPIPIDDAREIILSVFQSLSQKQVLDIGMDEREDAMLGWQKILWGWSIVPTASINSSTIKPIVERHIKVCEWEFIAYMWLVLIGTSRLDGSQLRVDLNDLIGKGIPVPLLKKVVGIE